jgi:4-hydroxybenzoate polyprenyltransferase
MLKFADRLIKSVEDSDHPFYYYLFVFVFSIVVRNFLEVFAYGEVQISSWYAHLHYSTYYLALVAWFIVLISTITKQKIDSVYKVVFTFIPIIIICPVIDLIALHTFDLKQTLGYLSPELHGAFFSKYFTYFGNSIGVTLNVQNVFKPNMGPSIGYRLEVLFVLIGFGFYFYSKTKNVFKTVVAVVISYTLIYLFCSTPYIISLITRPYSPQLVPYYLFLLFIGLVFIFAMRFPKQATIVFKDFRWLRLGYFELLFIFGAVYGLTKGGVFKLSILYNGIFAMIAIAMAWKHAVITNNMVDIEIDKISNPERPLFSDSISQKFYSNLAWVVFAIALIYAMYSSLLTFTFILIFMMNYFVYSAPPLRLKRVTILSKFPIAVNSLLLLLLGAGTVILNIIDLKDYEGDKSAGIKTLPVVIGLKPAKFWLAVLVLSAYLLSFIFMKNNAAYFILIGVGILQFMAINRKNYNDSLIISLMLLSLVIGISEKFI